MERASPPLLLSAVIEGVLDVTTVYAITFETRTKSRPATLCTSCQAAATQETQQAKSRPVATIRPLPAAKEEESQQQESEFPEIFGKEAEFPETLGKEEPVFTKQWKENEETCKETSDEKNSERQFGEQKEDKEVCSENTGENDSVCVLIEQSDSCGEEDTRVTHPPPQEHPEYRTLIPPLTSPNAPLTQPPQPSTKAKTTGQVKSPEQEFRDPCSCHRDKIRAVFGKGNVAPRKMEGYQNGECQDGQGCAEDCGRDLKGDQHKETCITECLDEFLEELQLTHLGNYLRVLGCTCVRDLRLLEEPELNAIQLISRRRLLKRLESLSLHHEAPPAECSLEGWLTWYGLTHISGFLSAIGVHSVGDLTYLKEEDLELLKPVTRRRILSCYRK